MKSSWTTKTIGQIGTVVGGGTPSTKVPSFYGGSIPWITPKDLSNHTGRYIYRGERNITPEGYDSCGAQMLPAGAVLFSSRAPIGYVAIAGVPVCTNQGFKSVVPNKDIDPLFLYYLLISERGKIESLGSGTTFKEVSGSTMKKVEVCVPPYETQKKIGKILSAIDEKIEINNSINGCLLEQAQAIFDEHYEQIVNDERNNLLIRDIPHVLETGKRPKGGATKSGVPSVGAENVKNLGEYDYSATKYVPNDFALSLKKGWINGYELLIYKDGGKPGTFIPHFSMFGEGFPFKGKFCINEHVFKLDFGDRGLNIFAYFLFQTPRVYKWIESNGAKAAIPGINSKVIEDIPFPRADNPFVIRFGNEVEPMFVKIFANCRQNSRLSEVRDYLLPKLMSGEIDVGSIQLD